jgi:Ni,Fe-hydrogenase III large subunit
VTSASDILRTTEAEVCRPWLRHILPHADWVNLANTAFAEKWILLAQWADTIQAHALFLVAETLTIIPVSTEIKSGRYPALSPAFPGAAWYERMVRDLWGHEADGSRDRRPWLDHGTWPQSHPMAARPDVRSGPGAQTGIEPPALFDPDPADAMILPLGPVWGHLDEAAHLRLTLAGSVITRAECLLGFSHKGTLALMRGKSPRTAARYAARLSADTTVAHSLAFAQATELALDFAAPPRASALRVIMLEIERIAGHLDNLAEVGRLAGARTVHAKCGYLREILLRATEFAFGHRLMMDCVVPGGIATDIADGGAAVLLRVLGDIGSELPAIRKHHDAGSLLSRLTGVGRAGEHLVTAFGAGGVAGRASGRSFDARTAFAAGYANPAPRVAALGAGDAAARQRQRIFEIEESLRLISLALQTLPQKPGPDGSVSVALPRISGEGIACAESIRGDVWHWLRLDHGQIAAGFARDPGWALWPVAEHVLTNAEAEDVDLIRASLGLPASGMDL